MSPSIFRVPDFLNKFSFPSEVRKCGISLQFFLVYIIWLCTFAEMDSFLEKCPRFYRSNVQAAAVLDKKKKRNKNNYQVQVIIIRYFLLYCTVMYFVECFQHKCWEGFQTCLVSMVASIPENYFPFKQLVYLSLPRRRNLTSV